MTHPVEGASAFARMLVERRLAACVNQLPVQSTYRWQERVTSDDEVLLIVKTQASCLESLERVLREDHPYDVPELVVFEPGKVEAGYLSWLLAETMHAADHD